MEGGSHGHASKPGPPKPSGNYAVCCVPLDFWRVKQGPSFCFHHFTMFTAHIDSVGKCSMCSSSVLVATSSSSFFTQVLRSINPPSDRSGRPQTCSPTRSGRRLHDDPSEGAQSKPNPKQSMGLERLPIKFGVDLRCLTAQSMVNVGQSSWIVGGIRGVFTPSLWTIYLYIYICNILSCGTQVRISAWSAP